MQAVTITQISPSELEALIDKAIDKALSNNPREVHFNPSERLTRKEIKSIYKVSYPTIHSAMNSGKLPFEKIGRKTLFRREDVEAFFRSSK